MQLRVWSTDSEQPTVVQESQLDGLGNESPWVSCLTELREGSRMAVGYGWCVSADANHLALKLCWQCGAAVGLSGGRAVRDAGGSRRSGFGCVGIAVTSIVVRYVC